MYYNTLKEEGKQLSLFKEKAKNQDQKILELFKVSGKSFPEFKLSASLIMPFLDCPITSIRRSLNTLDNNKKIRRTDVKVMGLYGRMEYLYKLC